MKSWISIFVLLWLSSPGVAAAVTPSGTPPVSERFQSESVAEVPDFQRHVGPLLGRLGCNGRACHGSFQGQGGFQLSLFGYDFSKDHQAIRSRVLPAQPASSLLLRKPTLQDDHEGGRRFADDSW